MAKKVVFVIAQKDFQDLELAAPKKILERRGIQTRVASASTDPASGKLGGKVKPDLALAEIKPGDFDAIVFVGGPGARDYLEDETALDLVRNFQKKNKIIAAICLGPSILANAGALISKTATATPSQEENLKNRGADYTGMPVEVDGLAVTARDPEAAEEFGEKLACLLEG